METRKILVIIFLAALLRLFWLNQVPPSLNWDEAAIAWNAKTIFHTRRDEYGVKLPLAFKSFGDYKAPVYIYLTAPIVGLFGVNQVTVRLVSVFAGIGSVWLIFLIAKILKQEIAIISAFLMAISPWHILLSRPAFEPNLALFFILAAVYCFLKALRENYFFVGFILSSVFSLYSYHSPKIFLPFFILGLIIIYFKQIFSRNNFKVLLISFILGLICLIPLIKATFYSQAGARFSATSIFYNQKGEKQPIDFKLIVNLIYNYLIHYSPTFLFWGNDQMPRLQVRYFGPILLVQAPFLIFGLIYLIRHHRQPWSKLLLLWFLLGPLPAVIGREVPHPIRSYNWLPVLIIISALGLKDYFNKSLIFFLLSLNFVFFSYYYFFIYPIYSAKDWQYGYQEASEFAKAEETSVERIIFTSAYGQPHVFTYVYQHREPLNVFWGAMSKYLFRDVKWPEDNQLKNHLLIGSPAEIPEDAPGIIKTINYPDGQPAFRIVKTKL